MRSIRQNNLFQHAIRTLILFAVVAASVWYGVKLRAWLWENTSQLRFTYDVDNAFNWGKQAASVGYFNLYDTLGPAYESRLAGGPGTVVDYAPFRLGMATLWVKWLEQNKAPLDARIDSHDYHQPMLRFNTFMELLAAVGAFLVVRQVVRQRHDFKVENVTSHGRIHREQLHPLRFNPEKLDQEQLQLAAEGNTLGDRVPTELAGNEGNDDLCVWRGAFSGVLAAMLTWFNPLILFNAHAWPQWDVWVLPFFFFAIYFGLRGWWLAAGVAVGLGSMFKSQIMFVAWTFPIWAAIAADWRLFVRLIHRHPVEALSAVAGPVRLFIGTAAAIAIVGLPWELTIYNPAVTTAGASAGASAGTSSVGHFGGLFGREIDYKAVTWLVVWVLAAVLLVRRRFSPTLVLAAVAIALLSTQYPIKPPEGSTSTAGARVFSGSSHWLTAAFGIGTFNYNSLVMGTASNIPALLRDTFGFDNTPVEQVVHPFYYIGTLYNGPSSLEWHYAVPLRTLLLNVFLLLTAVSAVMAGLHARRRDRRFLLAICLPWVLFYLILPQIHERYLLFAAGCTGLMVAVGTGWTLLGGVVTAIGLIATLHTAFEASHPQVSRAWFVRDAFDWLRYGRSICEGARPGIAWALLLAAAVMFYAILPIRRRKKVIQ